MRTLFLIALSVALCAPAAAQSTAPAKPKPAADPAAKSQDSAPDPIPIPAVTLQFEKQAAIPGAAISNAYYQPIACTPDGIPVVAYPKPFTPAAGHQLTGADFMPSIYSFDPKGSHGFSAAAPGLYDVWYRGYFVSASTLYITVEATPDDTQVTRTMTTPGGPSPQQVYSGKRHLYALEYDLQGNFKKAVPAPDRYRIIRMAALPDDTFVALAYDQANRAPRLLLLDSDLEILRPLEIPEEMANDPVLQRGETGGNFNLAMAMTQLSEWQFVSARNTVLLFQRHRAAPVVEIGPGGVVRQVTVQAPGGFEPELILAANDRWLMQFRRIGLPESGGYDARPQSGNVVLYEIDPNDGSLRRRLDLRPVDKDHPGIQFACERDGQVVGFHAEGNQMVRYTADIPR